MGLSVGGRLSEPWLAHVVAVLNDVVGTEAFSGFAKACSASATTLATLAARSDSSTDSRCPFARRCERVRGLMMRVVISFSDTPHFARAERASGGRPASTTLAKSASDRTSQPSVATPPRCSAATVASGCCSCTAWSLLSGRIGPWPHSRTTFPATYTGRNNVCRSAGISARSFGCGSQLCQRLPIVL